MGTPDFAKESLKVLYDEGFEICGVVTQPDRPSGRGMKINISPVKEYALEKNIRIFQPEKISKNIEFLNEITSLEPDLVCVVSYGVILPKSFLQIPKYGCINVHPSMLPKYRGPAPIQWAILNGDKTTGVTIMYLNEKMDAGDIITQEIVEIDDDETTGDLWNRLSIIGANQLLKVVKNIEKGEIRRVPQSQEYTLAPFLEKEIAKIDWNIKNANEIKNLVRGLNPIMGAYSYYNGKKIKFWKVKILSIDEFNKIYEKNLNFQTIENGEVILSNEKIGLFVKANNGIISVIEIQGENAKKMNIFEFLRGNKISFGEKFE